MKLGGWGVIHVNTNNLTPDTSETKELMCLGFRSPNNIVTQKALYGNTVLSVSLINGIY